MSILKDFRFTVDLKGDAERVVELTTDEGLALSVATPPEFRGGVHGCGLRSTCSSQVPRRVLA